MRLTFAEAREHDAAALASLRTAAATELTRRHGRGPWSHVVREHSVLRCIETSRVMVARFSDRIVGTVRLATKKPWAIDVRHFVRVAKPIYLHDLAVTPDMQGKGIGRALVEQAKAAARGWPGEAIRLDAHAGVAGAGGFYDKCGFREVGRATYRRVPLVYFELLL